MWREHKTIFGPRGTTAAFHVTGVVYQTVNLFGFRFGRPHWMTESCFLSVQHHRFVKVIWKDMRTARGLMTVLWVIAFLRFAPASAAADNNGIVDTTILSKIDIADLKRHCSFLAADALEGRAAGSRGGQAAAAYLVTELKKLELSPPSGQRDFRQSFGGQYTNIIAVIPGRHPIRKSEWIVVGGHYDHVGYGTAENSNGPIGKIHNGADDNGSGVSLLLELASLLADPATPRDRSIVIAFWDAEETGLLGSKHWVTQPTVMFHQVKLAVNLDMVGRLRDDHVAVMGWRSASGLRRAMVDANIDSPLKFGFDTAVTADSDHYSFFTARRPVLHFDTGKHVDYHRPSDDVEKVNFEGLERIGRFVGRLILNAANAPALPEFRTDAGNEAGLTRHDPKTRLAPPVRFGVRWSTQRSNADRFLEVADVIANTPAAKAGIRKGDRVLKLDRWTGGTLESFREAIAVAPTEVDVEWQPVGQTEVKSTRMQLAGEGVRLGITYRSDPALPGCGVITGVMSYTPAERAGFQPGDVLMTLNEEAFPSFEKLGDHLPSGAVPITIFFERQGQPKRVTFTLP